MPALSFRLPRFLHRSRRSHSPKPSSAGPRDDAAASHSPSPALSSHPLSTPGAPQHAVDDAIVTSHSPAPNNLTNPLHSPGRIFVDRALRESDGQRSQASRPVTPINVGDATSALGILPQESVARLPVLRPHLPDSSDSAQFLHTYDLLAEPSQQSLVSERQNPPPGEDLPLRPNQNRGMFYQAHNLAATGNFIDGNVGNVTTYFNASNNFMEKLLKETIPGAAADSSARDPPPRCHPGTRLAILERCLHFIVHCSGVEKVRWVVGAAGVGKSAVMQSVTESPQLKVAYNASVFFSINGRNDGTKAIMTLSYQFAAKSKVYRQVIEGQVADDPSLLQSSMSAQFEKFIVDPFIYNPNLNSAGRVLIIIDGLDECSNTRIQVELLRLISNFCISYPSSPIVWLIASRPELHITTFFSRPEVLPVYEKEEIAIDSDEAQADVERFLRHELTEIGNASDISSPKWPDEQHFWKLAKAASGLFAYAHTVVRYIGDSSVGDPVSQLSDVLNVIDELPLSEIPPEQHPMAQLDALYARVLLNVPAKIMINARKFLLLLVSNWDLALHKQEWKNLIIMCNWLGMTADEAYAALNRLRSVLYFPPRHEAHKEMTKIFHKSLIDYMSRSDFFPDIKLEAQQIKTQCAFRVLKEASDGIDYGNKDNLFYHGWLACNHGTRDKISTTWCAGERIGWDDDDTRLSMYKLAIGEVLAGMKRGDPTFQSELCINLLTTRYWHNFFGFPYPELRDLVFDKSRCHEFIKHGILKPIPAKAINISKIETNFDVELHFHRRVVTTTLLDPWKSSCKHERVGKWEQGKEQAWTTAFVPKNCDFCFNRLKQQLNIWITRHPDHAVMIMLALKRSCVKVQFVDPEDGVSEWTYWFWILHFELEERKELEEQCIV